MGAVVVQTGPCEYRQAGREPNCYISTHPWPVSRETLARRARIQQNVSRMGAVLPELSVDRFARRLLATIDTQLSAEVQERLFKHYEELRRWNPRLSLIGPGTAAEVKVRAVKSSRTRTRARESVRREGRAEEWGRLPGSSARRRVSRRRGLVDRAAAAQVGVSAQRGGRGAIAVSLPRC